MKLHDKILIAVLALFCLGTNAFCEGYDYSWHGVYWPSGYTNDLECDSGSVSFAFPDTTNYYFTSAILPSDLDSTVMLLDSLYLDSVGTHRWMVVFWLRDATVPDTNWGVWVNTAAYGRPMPAAASGANFVAAYIDLASGIVDAVGDMIPRTGVTLYCNLIARGYITDGTWAFIPKTYEEEPDATGRVTFKLPATTVLSPPGAYYNLTWKATDGWSNHRGHLRNFILDTIPDPVDIRETTRVR